MSNTPKNKKYVELDKVRVYFNKNENSIQIISKDKDLAGKPFQITLNKGTDSEQTLRDLLQESGVKPPERRDNIPTMAYYPTEENNGLSKIPETLKNNNSALIGVTENNQPYAVDLEKPSNILINGRIGYGKSVLEQNFILHALKYVNDYDLAVIDHRYDMDYLRKENPKNLLGISSNIEDTITILKFVQENIKKRKQVMKEYGISSFQELTQNNDFSAAKKLMFVISNLHDLLKKPINYPREEQIKQELLYNEFMKLLTDILCEEEDTGVFILANNSLLTDLPEQIDERFKIKILMGNDNEKVAKRFFKEHSEKTFKKPGEAVIKVPHKPTQLFQIYFSNIDIVEETINTAKD